MAEWFRVTRVAEGADIHSLLILPVQRLPRYNMLLGRIVALYHRSFTLY